MRIVLCKITIKRLRLISHIKRFAGVISLLLPISTQVRRLKQERMILIKISILVKSWWMGEYVEGPRHVDNDCRPPIKPKDISTCRWFCQHVSDAEGNRGKALSHLQLMQDDIDQDVGLMHFPNKIWPACRWAYGLFLKHPECSRSWFLVYV